MDDVLTTGGRIAKWLRSPFRGERKPDYIAVLVNRSTLDEIDGIPIISGIKADPVEVQR